MRIDAGTVLALARSQGQEWIDDEAAARVAAGATAAVAAVAAVLEGLDPGVLTTDAAEFETVLATLAGPES